ncbi:uncharacterized protein LOC126857493 [Cataglyphis hispanica]|uniref:uncharacterized protein LOC126857493 n=1 Tax=Cataglyphis hispanica TaxID=1086592 RepID=UPI00217F936D|nr:uncharacterized protein LOC126857493 [Cataglyphis hispanica]
METRERVLNFAEKDEINEICEEKRCIRDRGKIIVVVSATETRPSVSSEYLERKKVNGEISLVDVTSSMHSMRENDDDDDDDKENAEEKRISDESKTSRGNREADKIFPQQQQRQQVNRSPRRKSAGIPTLLCIDGGGLTDATAVEVKRKIPRPANAFMLFANEWRRKLAAENPRESNKDISVRLVLFFFFKQKCLFLFSLFFIR